MSNGSGAYAMEAGHMRWRWVTCDGGGTYMMEAGLATGVGACAGNEGYSRAARENVMDWMKQAG